MKKLLQQTNIWKRTLFGLLTLAIIASPFSFSKTQSLTLDTAYAAAAQCSGADLATKSANPNVFPTNADPSAVYACTDPTGTGQIFYFDQGWNNVSNYNPQTGITRQKDGTFVATPTTCSSVLAFMASPFTCMFRAMVSLTAATLIYIASWLLTVAGVLFNWLIDNTIVHFTNVYTAGVQSAVENGWTAFRDIANILIIGMFTFIAVSLILGLKEFNQKRLIANVLIIAVLINFSLLFTKMVIDASNFVAGQIYSAAALDGNGNQYSATGVGTLNSTGTGNGDSANVASAGIAGQFINLLGVQSFPNAFKAVNNIAEAKDSGWVALLHGILVFVILVGAALVLFYGSFLLISRMILLIFLMFSASIAFASYIMPKWSGSSYGWSTWLTTLIKTTMLAPILMLLLWITLNISTAIHCPGGNCQAGTGSFGDILANPTSAPDISTLVNYCIILGLLFVSFKLSNLFASKIAGFNYASMIPGIGTGVAGALAGFVGRNTLGWGGAVAGGALRRYTNRPNENDVYGENGELLRRGQNYDSRRTGLRGVLNRAATRASLGVSESTLNPLKSKIGSTLGSTVGVPKMFVGKNAPGTSSFDEKMKEKAKAADESARKTGPTDDQKDQVRRNAEGEQKRQFNEQKNQLGQIITQQAATRDAIKAERPQAEQDARQTQQPERRDEAIRAQAHDEGLRRAETEKLTVRTRQESEMRAAHNDIERAALTARHQVELNQIDERIAGHKEDVAAVKERLENLETEAKETADAQLAPRLADLDRTIKQNTDRLGELKGIEKETVEKAGKQAVETVDKNARTQRLWDPRAAGKLTGVMRNHDRDENLKNLRGILNPDQTGTGGGAH